MKKTWKVINELLKKHSSKSSSTDHIEKFHDNGIPITGKKNITNAFNNYFVNIGPKLASKIEKLPNQDYSHFMGNRNESSMFLSPITENDLLEVVKNFKPKNSKDLENVSMNTLKKLVTTIAEPLTYICNLSFQTGIFPEKMKSAKVNPIF